MDTNLAIVKVRFAVFQIAEMFFQKINLYVKFSLSKTSKLISYFNFKCRYIFLSETKIICPKEVLNYRGLTVVKV